MRVCWAVDIVLLLCSALLAECNEPAPNPDFKPQPINRFCHSCVAKAKVIDNTTRCTTATFVKKLGIACKPEAYCYTEIIKPAAGNAGNIILKRGCAGYSMNSCVAAVLKKGGNFTKCVKSCDEDGCNTDNSIFIPTTSSFGVECNGTSPGNGSKNVHKIPEFILASLALTLMQYMKSVI